MATLNETILLLSFVAFLFVFGYKLYNIFIRNDEYGYPQIFLGFIGGLFSWGIILFMALLGFENLTSVLILRLSSAMLPFLILLLIIEVMLEFRRLNPTSRTRYIAERGR